MEDFYFFLTQNGGGNLLLLQKIFHFSEFLKSDPFCTSTLNFN